MSIENVSLCRSFSWQKYLADISLCISNLKESHFQVALKYIQFILYPFDPHKIIVVFDITNMIPLVPQRAYEVHFCFLNPCLLFSFECPSRFDFVYQTPPPTPPPQDCYQTVLTLLFQLEKNYGPFNSKVLSLIMQQMNKSHTRSCAHT